MERPAPPPEPLAFSIVIPTYLRAALLARVLPSYLATGAEDVVLVDDDSGPPHDGILQRLADLGPRVQVMTLPRHAGQAEAKNEGVGRASPRAEWIVFGEDDVWFPPEYPGLLIEHALATRAKVASGAVPLVDPALLDGPRSELEAAIRTRPMDNQPPDRFLGGPWPVRNLSTGDTVTPLLSACAAVHRSVFERLRFDPRYTGNAFREETDFFFSCAEAGIRTIHCPHAACGHLKRTTRSTPGGSWTMSRPSYALQMVANNGRFLHKHEAYVRRERARVGRSGGTLRMQAAFVRSMLGRLRAPRS